MLGALIKLTGVIDMKYLVKKIEDMFLKKIGSEKTNANINAIKMAHDEVKA